MVTPYLKKFNTEGGTLYVFPSVSNDLTRTTVSSDYEMKFSHFACLNIPDIVSGTYGEDSDSDPTNDMEKGLYLDTLREGRKAGSWTKNTDIERNLVENLQNYVMNFESAIINGEGDNDDYDSDILTTVSEKVFFNWLRKVGAIKFNSNENEESFVNPVTRTVQYIGNIDLMNSVEIGGDMFEEIYIHIPSTVGSSTHVYFRTGEMTDDKNYLNKKYPVANKIGSYEYPRYIQGRKDTDKDKHPEKYSTFAIYDLDDGANTYTGDVGHTIDFRDSTYGDGISTMNGNSVEDFEFNAVLIYYDLYKKTSTPGVKAMATNLYGILFLDNVTKSENKNYIQRYPKKKETVYGSGNSFALKLDLKIDTFGDYDNTTYVEVPDENYQRDKVVSMIMYNRALEQLQKCSDLFFTQKAMISKLSERVEILENLVLGIDSVSSLQAAVDELYYKYDGTLMVDTNTLLSLIDANAKKIDSIMSGEKNLKLQYDTDVIQPGVGIGIQKSKNKVVISSEQTYSINEVTPGEFKTNAPEPCTIKLRPGENLAIMNVNDLGECGNDMRISIDTSEYSWVAGQSLKIYFTYPNGGELRFTDGDTYGIRIKPKNDVSDVYISGTEFEGNNLIEIIYIGENKFIHLIK